MILTCPDCATRYFVEDRRVGPIGRTVRCANCGASWRARPEEETPLELGASPDEGAYAFPPNEPLSFKPIEPHELPAPELPKAFRAKAAQQRQARKAAATGAVWTGLAFSFLGLLTAAWAFRVDVARVLPQAGAAYALVKVNATGLEIVDVRAQPSASDPGVVTVQGRLHNVIGDAAAVPLIRVVLLDKKGIRMKQQVIQLDKTALAAGASLPFTANLPDPKAGAADVDVSFALDVAPPKRAAAAKPVETKPSPAAPAAATPATQPAKAQPAAAQPASSGPPALRPAFDPGPSPPTSAHAPVGLRGLDTVH